MNERTWRCRVWRGRGEVYEAAPEDRELDLAGAVAWMRSQCGDDPGRVYWDVVRLMLEQGRSVSREDRYEDGGLLSVDLSPAFLVGRGTGATAAEPSPAREERGGEPGGHGATAAGHEPGPGDLGHGPEPGARGRGPEQGPRGYGTEPGIRGYGVEPGIREHGTEPGGRERGRRGRGLGGRG